VGHVHISDPGLLPVGDSKSDHTSLVSAIRQYLPEHICTIEMLATSTEPHMISVARALQFVCDQYGDSIDA